MNDAGYTLTETLAAMAVIGLAAGGLALGMQVLGAQQWRVGGVVRNLQDARAAEAWIERRLAEHGPYRAHQPERLSGGAAGFRFACGGTGDCEVRLTMETNPAALSIRAGAAEPMVFQLPSDGPARFVYRGQGEAGAAWPPAAGPRQALRSISLVQGQGSRAQALLEATVHAEQPLDCAFDPVLQDCR